MRMKSTFKRMNGTYKDFGASYMDKFMWRERYSKTQKIKRSFSGPPIRMKEYELDHGCLITHINNLYIPITLRRHSKHTVPLPIDTPCAWFKIQPITGQLSIVPGAALPWIIMGSPLLNNRPLLTSRVYNSIFIIEVTTI